MDVEVVMMHRTHEEYDADHNTDTAVIRGLSLPGKLMVCAALVPSRTSLMRLWNWWLPSWLNWIVPKEAAFTPWVTSERARKATWLSLVARDTATWSCGCLGSRSSGVRKVAIFRLPDHE